MSDMTLTEMDFDEKSNFFDEICIKVYQLLSVFDTLADVKDYLHSIMQTKLTELENREKGAFFLSGQRGEGKYESR